MLDLIYAHKQLSMQLRDYYVHQTELLVWHSAR